MEGVAYSYSLPRVIRPYSHQKVEISRDRRVAQGDQRTTAPLTITSSEDPQFLRELDQITAQLAAGRFVDETATRAETNGVVFQRVHLTESRFLSVLADHEIIEMVVPRAMTWDGEEESHVENAPHEHHQMTESFFVTKGQVSFTCDGAVTQLGSGESLTVPVGSPHKWSALSDGIRMFAIFSRDLNMAGFFLRVASMYGQHQGGMAALQNKLKPLSREFDVIQVESCDPDGEEGLIDPDNSPRAAKTVQGQVQKQVQKPESHPYQTAC